MKKQITIDGIEILIQRKKIKNLYIRILPPDGIVKMTVPKSMTDARLLVFATEKMDWIKKHKEKYDNCSNPIDIQYETGETHYLWGVGYPLEVKKSGAHNKVMLQDNHIILQVGKDSTVEQRKVVMEEWYRQQLKQEIPAVLESCVKVVGKTPSEWRVKNMKTRWGTCNTVQKRIWLNLQLTKKSPECLEYVMIHELVHLYTRKHDAHFKAYMDRFYPNWKEVKKRLNELT